jgi:hypothetical protein
MVSADKPKGGSGGTVLVVGLIICCLVGYNWADGSGWIPHSGKTNVKFPMHAWEVGEYLTCAAVTIPKSEPDLDCSGDALDSSTVREMDVTLWGQMGEKPVIFKCQRTTESINCHLP